MSRYRWLAATLFVVVVLATAGGPAPALAAGRVDQVARAVGRPSKQSDSQTVKSAIADIQDYWASTMADVYGKRYERIAAAKVRPYTSKSDLAKVSKCAKDATYKDVANNAFYCFLDRTVSYDAQGLVPSLSKQFGPFAVELVFAHEWGHAIQDQTNTKFDNTVFQETQADCFAGAFVAHLAKGGDKRLKYKTADLDTGLAALMGFRDPLGNDPRDKRAHGSGFDRVNAFQLGYEGGAKRCAEWATNPPQIVEIPFTSAQDLANQGNLPYTDILPTTQKDLNDYWSQIVSPYTQPSQVIPYNPDTSDLPNCPSLKLSPKDYRGTIFYCADGDFIAFDRTFFRSVYNDIGDFGIATLISNAWASAMQNRLGYKGDPGQLGLQADCFSGSYAGSVPVDDPPTVTARGTPVSRPTEYSLSPGDLDEVVQAFLLFGTPAGSSDSGRGTTFERLQAFRTGFVGGEQACVNLGSSSTQSAGGQ